VVCAVQVVARENYLIFKISQLLVRFFDLNLSYCSGRFATMTYIQNYLQLMKPPVLASMENKTKEIRYIIIRASTPHPHYGIVTIPPPSPSCPLSPTLPRPRSTLPKPRSAPLPRPRFPPSPHHHLLHRYPRPPLMRLVYEIIQPHHYRKKMNWVTNKQQ
jgi:hypothetical protein